VCTKETLTSTCLPKQVVRVGGNSKQGNRLESHFQILSELPFQSTQNPSYAFPNPVSGRLSSFPKAVRQ
jgi:hypothetical protein